MRVVKITCGLEFVFCGQKKGDIIQNKLGDPNVGSVEKMSDEKNFFIVCRV